MTEPLARILVADDEPDLRALLQRYLGDQGYAVRAVDGAAPLERLLARERFDVLVLDVMMPGEDGLSLCRRLRAQGETIPILMLTARGDPVDRVVGLEMGADDYLPKPFQPRELLARIQALVRRQRLLGAHHGPVTAAAAPECIGFGDCTLWPGTRRLQRAGQEVDLSSTEFALLLAFARQPRRPLGRDRLIALAYGPGHVATDRSIDVQVMRLRKLIEPDPAHPRHLRTVWGVGYVFLPDGPVPLPAGSPRASRSGGAAMNTAASMAPAGHGWPRSLFGRHLLLIVALVVAGQLCAAWLARRLIVEPRVATAAEGSARQLAALRAGLQALPPAQRQAFVDAFNRQVAGMQGRAQGPGTPSPQGSPALTPLERRFQQALSDRLGATGWLVPGTGYVWQRGGAGVLWLRLQQLPDAGADPAAAWVALPVTGTFRAFTGAWLAATLAGGLLALAGAAWLQRQLHRPLRRVVAAAQAIARGQPHTPLPEDGPQEIAALAHGINHMAEALQAADRERALMLAGISHDLRTPLTKLRLAAEIARPHMEPALAASMERSVDEMDAVVVQFMDFARLDAGPEGREAAHAAPLDALAEALAEAQAGHGRVLALECGAPTPVAVQPRALRRAVENLVENAWRHGLPPVVLRTGEDADGATAWIEVADSGTGIDPAELERLRRPFARGSGTARAGTPGAGLGLAIADRVARLHGGRLDLHGVPGQGLRARIVVPMRPAHGDAPVPGRE